MTALDEKVWWTATSQSTKTGPIPQGFIGHDPTAALESCRAAGCPLLPRGHGGNGRCYAWMGTPRLVLGRTTASRAQVRQLPLHQALTERSPRARFVRLGALGDPCVLTRQEVSQLRGELQQAGLGLLAYTHGWYDAGAHLRGQVMASTDALWEADEALAAGWRATTVLPAGSSTHGHRTPGGRRVVVCPAQSKPGVDCNRCGACDASRPGPVIGFIEHGPGVTRRRHTTHTRRRALDLVAAGASLLTAAKRVGTTETTVRRWAKECETHE